MSLIEQFIWHQNRVKIKKTDWKGCERKQLCPHSHTAPTLSAETEENHKPQSTGLDHRLKFETRAL